MEYMDDYIRIHFDHTLLSLVMHSVFLILVITALFLWIFEKVQCCRLQKGTVCQYWGCGAFWAVCCDECCRHNFEFKDKGKEFEKFEILPCLNPYKFHSHPPYVQEMV